MTALSFRCEARSRIATISAFCSPDVNPLREGQSIFTTVAIQAARNSRVGAGGLMELSRYVALRELAATANIVKRANALVTPAIGNTDMLSCSGAQEEGKPWTSQSEMAFASLFFDPKASLLNVHSVRVST